MGKLFLYTHLGRKLKSYVCPLMLSVSNEPNDFKSLFLLSRDFNKQFLLFIIVFIVFRLW